MNDRRLHPATQRIAHASLRGKVSGLPFTDGSDAEIAAPLANLFSAPGGPIDRQMLYGDAFCIVDEGESHAFGFARKDGYCGWVFKTALRPLRPKTHWIAALASHLYPEARVQAAPITPLPMGARVQVLGQDGNFALTDHGFVPLPHLRPVGMHFSDPVAIAETFLGCPYMWAGNSAVGIDCSGLVQAALLACGIAARGDSDLQQTLGAPIALGAPMLRGDLVFWRGHVALVVDDQRLIHANGHTMTVAYEATAPCIARIKAAGGGEITHQRRL